MMRSSHESNSSIILNRQSIGKHSPFLVKSSNDQTSRTQWLQQNQLTLESLSRFQTQSKQAQNHDSLPVFNSYKEQNFSIQIESQSKPMLHWIYGDRVRCIKKRIGPNKQNSVYLVEWSNNRIGITNYQNLSKYEPALLISFQIRQSIASIIQQVYS